MCTVVSERNVNKALHGFALLPETAIHPLFNVSSFFILDFKKLLFMIITLYKPFKVEHTLEHILEHERNKSYFRTRTKPNILQDKN